MKRLCLDGGELYALGEDGKVSVGMDQFILYVALSRRLRRVLVARSAKVTPAGVMVQFKARVGNQITYNKIRHPEGRERVPRFHQRASSPEGPCVF
jgi:hypothetical protein